MCLSPPVIGLAVFLAITLPLGAENVAPSPPIKIILSEPASPVTVSPLLFGQFLERTETGNQGAESAFDAAANGYPPNVVEALRKMQIPVIRFPGGTSVDQVDWLNMIDHVPGRTGPRPETPSWDGSKTTTNLFGYDEYFALRDQLHCQTILVLNFLDAASRKLPLEEAANHAVGLLAYANAPVGAKLPEGMTDWPAVRAANGHPAPFKADYVQLGNEWWINHFHDVVVEKTGITDSKAIAAWYLECLKVYIAKIRQIDPKIPIILDGMMGDDIDQIVLGNHFIRANVRYITFHTYGPGPADKLTSNGKDYPADQMTTGDWWNSWVTMPGEMSAAGENIALGERSDFATKHGYRIACTEWNWNGFGFERLPKPPSIGHLLPATLGTASFLNGLLRQSGSIDLATQSNLVGKWRLSAVEAGLPGMTDPVYSPMSRAVTLYNLHHGDRLLETQIIGNTTYPLTVGTWWDKPPKAPVAYLDVVATASSNTIFLHIVNRHMDQAAPLHLDLGALGKFGAPGAQYSLTGSTDSANDKALPDFGLNQTESPVTPSGAILDLVLPARSVNIIALPYIATGK